MTTSASIPDASSSPAAPAERREHTGGILGTTIGLVVLAGLLLMLGKRFAGGSVDGAERLVQLFGESAPPFGLELAEAARLPTGDLIVRLVPPADREAANPAEPVEVLFMEYRSRGAVAPLFQQTGDPSADSGRMATWEKKKDFAWNATLERDEIAWGKWRANYAIVRSFEKGGGWQDEARVDLSRKDRPLVLFAHWPKETPVDKAKLKELLGSIALEEPPKE